MSPSEPKTYTVHEFAHAIGLGPRKFMDALRDGTIPLPLNPTAKKVAQFRWASGTVVAFIGGTYRGPMLPAGQVPPPPVPAARAAAAAATAPVVEPKKVKKTNQESERLSDVRRAVFDLLDPDSAAKDTTQSVLYTRHSDGSITLQSVIPNKN